MSQLSLIADLSVLIDRLLAFALGALVGSAATWFLGPPR